MNEARRSPTTQELYWAAGFLEGEGCFSVTTARKAERVVAGQVDSEPLAKLKEIFGGNINYTEPKSEKQKPVFRWSVWGARARGVMLTLFPLMSERKQNQIIKALAAKPKLAYVRS